MMTKLCRAMQQSLTKFFQIGCELKKARPGLIACIQTFGDTLHPHTHLHVLVSEGAFTDQGFHRFAFDPEDLKRLETIFAQKVFALLLKTQKITPWIKEQMATWKHSGFSVDASVRILPNDPEGLTRLLRYMARAPVSKERIAYDPTSGQVTLFSAKDRYRVVATHPALEFLALLSLQVPPKGSHLIRYYDNLEKRPLPG